MADCTYEVVPIGYPGVVIGGWPLHELRTLRRVLKRLGKKRWSRHVASVVERFKLALEADYFVIGGGNAEKAGEVPPGAPLGTNANAITGGFRLWRETQPAVRKRTAHR